MIEGCISSINKFRWNHESTVPGALVTWGWRRRRERAFAAQKSLVSALADWRSKLDGLTGDLLARLRAALTLGQDTRLLQLETPLESGALVVERCCITEAVHANEPLWAEIDCVSTSPNWPLKALTGRLPSQAATG